MEGKLFVNYFKLRWKYFVYVLFSQSWMGEVSVSVGYYHLIHYTHTRESGGGEMKIIEMRIEELFFLFLRAFESFHN